MPSHIRLVSLLLVAALVSSCGSDGEEQQFTPDELEAALLTTDDVGADWTEEARETFTTRTDEKPPTMDPGMWCPDAAEQAAALDDLAGDEGAFVTLEAGKEGRTFQGLIEEAWSSDDATEYVTQVAAAVETCMDTEWAAEAEGEGTSMTELEGPKVGDESVAALVTYVTPSPEGDFAWRQRLVVSRTGTTIVVLKELDVQAVGSDAFWTQDEWNSMVETAESRIEDLAVG